MKLNIKQLRKLIREEVEKAGYNQTMENKLIANQVALQYPQLWSKFLEFIRESIIINNEYSDESVDPDVVLLGEPNEIIANLHSLEDKQIVTFYQNENIIYVNVWGDRGRFNEPILALDTNTNQIWDVQSDYEDIPEDIRELIFDI